MPRKSDSHVKKHAPMRQGKREQSEWRQESFQTVPLLTPTLQIRTLGLKSLCTSPIITLLVRFRASANPWSVSQTNVHPTV